MLDARSLVAERQESARLMAIRGVEHPDAVLDELQQLLNERKELAGFVDGLRAERKELSAEVGLLKKAGDSAAAESLLASAEKTRERLLSGEHRLTEVEVGIHEILTGLPNLPHSSVPRTEAKILRESGEQRVFGFEPRHHVELGESLGLLNFATASALSGSGFALYSGLGARLELALIHFMLEYHAERGYEAFLPPILARENCFYVSGQLPKFGDQLYACERDGLFLNPTAETLLASFHAGVVLEDAQLPIRYCAYTPCFRREAGSYGAEERGLIRLHQFNKVELFKFSRPEESYNDLDELIRDAEGVLQALGLHFRTVLLPADDMAQQSAKTVDIEVWLPGQQRYYEVSSCSNCEEFQARRSSTRFRREKGAKPEYVHTLNGSGLATSRLFAAIIENNQLEDGSVAVPDALQPLVGGVEIIEP